MMYHLFQNSIKNVVKKTKCLTENLAVRKLNLPSVHYANLISARLLNKPYVNEVTLSKQNPALKCC